MEKSTQIFHNNKILKQCICLSVILVDSDFRTGNTYYPQEECKYDVKEKKISKNIIDDIEISSNSDEENSDEENSNEENSGEENSDEENSDEEN